MGGLLVAGGGVVSAFLGLALGGIGAGEVLTALGETALTGGWASIAAFFQLNAGIGHVGIGVVAVGSGVFVFVQGGEIIGSAFCQ